MEEKEIYDKVSKEALRVLEGLLILLVFCMAIHWNSQDEPSNLDHALHGMYSDAGNAAAYIRENINPDELIVSDNIPMASTVLAYLRDYEFYYAGNGRKESYADWSEEQSRTISYGKLLSWVREAFPGKDEFFLIQTNESCIEESENLEGSKLLYQSESETVRNEEYKIFRVRLE